MKTIENLVELCVKNHTPEELALGWMRYETLRKLSPRAFSEINRRNLAGERFDDMITEALLTWKEPTR